MKEMQGKVALVTGGSTGIGKAAAVEFARQGASVVIAARREEPGLAAAEEIRAIGTECVFVRCDIAEPDDVAALVAAALKRFGRLDYAFNNAGISPAGRLPIAEQETAHFDEIVGINLRGTWLCLRAEIPAILAGGGGAIVNCSSVGSAIPLPGLALYSATKAGVDALTRNAAIEYAAQGIRVNSVCPAVIKTEMADNVFGLSQPEAAAAVAAMHALGRVGQPREIGAAVVWLCSEAASFVTGTCFHVDGGASLVN